MFLALLTAFTAYNMGAQLQICNSLGDSKETGEPKEKDTKVRVHTLRLAFVPFLTTNSTTLTSFVQCFDTFMT